MKMRSTIFLTLSIIVHAVCITALALSHFTSLESPDGNAVEVTMGETSKEETGKLVASNEVQPESQPVVKPIEKVEAPKPLPKKEVVKAKKIVKAKPATTLPPKEKIAAETEPESMNPKIEDSDAVAVATPEEPQEKEEAPKFIPVKEKVSAQALDEAEDKTEASSKDINVEDPAPAPEAKPAAPPTSGQNDASKKEEPKLVAALGQGGETKTEAVDFKELRQFSGNKPPVYPMSARKDSRQGEVDLLYRVTKEGRVSEVQIHKSSGHSDLDEAAVKAVAKYKFIPGQEGWAKQPVIFTLKGVASALPSKLRSNSAAAE